MTKYKYKLLNKYGNRVEYTNSEVEKNILLDRGFHIDPSWGEKPKNTTPVKRKAAKKDEGKLAD